MKPQQWTDDERELAQLLDSHEIADCSVCGCGLITECNCAVEDLSGTDWALHRARAVLASDVVRRHVEKLAGGMPAPEQSDPHTIYYAEVVVEPGVATSLVVTEVVRDGVHEDSREIVTQSSHGEHWGQTAIGLDVESFDRALDELGYTREKSWLKTASGSPSLVVAACVPKT